MKKRIKNILNYFPLFLILLFIILSLNYVYAIGSSSYNITNPTVSSGADNSSSVNYKTGLIIEDFSGNSSSSNYKSSFGFYYASSGNVTADITLPTFNNLRNFTHMANISFSQSITASDASGIYNYYLNNTNIFNISNSGQIINITNLSEIVIYWLNITATDNSSNKNNISRMFYINITPFTSPSIAVNSPIATTYSSAAIIFNATLSESGYCEYSLDSGITNKTMATNDNLTFYNTSSLSDGTYAVKFYCNSSFGIKNETTVSFTITTSSPIIPPAASGGGGGLAEIIKKIIIPSKISIIPPELEISTIINTIKTRDLTIINDNEKSENVQVQISPELKDIILIKDEETSFKLNGNSRKILILKIISPEKPGIYVGKILVNNQEVLVSINVNSKELLFDATISIPEESKILNKGNKLTSQVTLIPMGEKPRVDVTLNYVIKDFNGKSFIKESETFLIEAQKTFKKEFNTQNLPVGDYVLGLELMYPESIATSSSHFKVKSRFSINLIWLEIAIGLIGIIIIIGVIIYSTRKYKNTERLKE